MLNSASFRLVLVLFFSGIVFNTFSFADYILTTNETWGPNVTINKTENVIVPNGFSLTIKPGTHVNFAAGKGIIVNPGGSLYVQGISSNIIYFNVNGSGMWSGITFNNVSSGTNYGGGFIEYADIQYASNGIQLINPNISCFTPTITIDNCIIHLNSVYGVYISQWASTVINNCVFANMGGSAIYCNNTHQNIYAAACLKDPAIYSNTMYGCAVGVSSVNSSSPILLTVNRTNSTISSAGRNHIYNCVYGITASSSSSPFLGGTFADGNTYGGQNAVYNNSSYNAKASNSSHIIAENTWWGQNPPNTSLFNSDGTSSIDYANYLSYMPKINALNNGGIVLVSNSSPTSFALFDNYPNPFNPSTVISYDIPVKGQVVLKIFNMAGQEVKTLLNNVVTPGRYQMTWNGDNNFGRKLASGIYLYQMIYNKQQVVKKMVLLK